MAEVPRPVRRVLRDPVDEASFQRMWRAVGVRRARSWHGRRHRVVWIAAPLAAAAVVLAIVAISSPERADVVVAPTHGPLHTVGGAAPIAIAAAVRLSDGSRIVPSSSAEVRVVDNTGSSFATRLDRGAARFEIEPGGPRRWTVDCGLAVVSVLGTVFEVERDENRVRVAVERGVVRVDDRVNRRRRTLRAGDSIVIERPAPPAPRVEAPALAGDPVAIERRAPAASSWASLAREGEYHRAWAVLGRDGLVRESRRATPAELLALADVARLSGHPADAVAPLERLLAAHSGDANAGLAAFTLGVVHMDQLSDPRAAAAALDRALELGLPPSLQEDALARLAIARGRSGDTDGAAQAAGRYLQRAPDGARREEVRRWAP